MTHPRWCNPDACTISGGGIHSTEYVIVRGAAADARLRLRLWTPDLVETGSLLELATASPKMDLTRMQATTLVAGLNSLLARARRG